ncbi:protein of unknown function (DUF397) [Streptoalloteichus tenebrarius]|uniref:DUF397 domain-containing protein n=1 Tax=Streptoalloteichus tenebrarius (strain ATCC 17920 / DSM 40477 / JCM 4838 / CBS 697.72 / NBRC 16177 / NCIMB 11028 / NRRL B-12390 / A12253. 1 / ISP 5477) TaxID=1933 RepID=A0ABT1HMC3_STRSD|nr:DUF397 domain-containing protein [Streptoalloteichus tenebrarius]MCP2256664.1 protein of unknown function (DUF397) [Streptoalloteichus tenebrarius]MCP2257238.1 protein of unknown function (DUF397) [Streptoalloteichus tenebrarius]BFE98876.1 DUF397 domain-containing protein [Streptoalloteichus tenebrarius]BFF05018.1 DUF397 domain-containing protein [Streptoalloteichus tenebrarius]
MAAQPSNPYNEIDDAQYQAVVEASYQKSSYSSGNGGCLSFAVVGGLIGLQDDKLDEAERKRRTLVFTPQEMAAFIAGAKAGEFDHLV